MPMRPRRTRKPKIIHIHDQHGQSAFNPKARARSNELDGIVFDVVVYTIGLGSGETCIFTYISIHISVITYYICISSGN